MTVAELERHYPYQWVRPSYWLIYCWQEIDMKSQKIYCDPLRFRQMLQGLC